MAKCKALTGSAVKGLNSLRLPHTEDDVIHAVEQRWGEADDLSSTETHTATNEFDETAIPARHLVSSVRL